MKVSGKIPFPYSLEKARKIAEQAMALHGKEHQDAKPTFAWDKEDQRKANFSFDVFGSTIRGVLLINEKAKELTIEGDVPYAYKVFFPQAIEEIKEAISRIAKT